MKFMKLGSKPDAFQADGNRIRFVSSELATDFVINVGEVKFYLHKFPLLWKSNYLQKLVVPKANEEISDEIDIPGFPGGPKAFEICAKFCYGMTVTLNAYNVTAVRCAAEFLEMTEAVDKGNLIFKIEVFLNSSVFRSWKDSIIVLQTSKSLLPWSEDLKIVGRCIDSIASKTSVDPSNINWSYTYNRKLAGEITTFDSMRKFQNKNESVPKDWWVEDICELDIDLYKRVMIAVKSKGRMNGNVIGEALKTYAIRWLPDCVNALTSDTHMALNKYLVETIICLLPSARDSGCSCSFLLKLLKVAVLVGADESARENLEARISLKLDEASVNDLLIPARFPRTTLYDVDLVQNIVRRFAMQEICSELSIAERDSRCNSEFVLSHVPSLPWLNVGKLIDSYLLEVAGDPNFPLSSFINLSRSVPDSARPIHDELYRAIDIYLKEHLGLTKAEKKKICGLMDVKKLTMDMSMHAAQNERLPLRVVVQVLFFEQIRGAAVVQSASTTPHDASHSTTNTEEEWNKIEHGSFRSLTRQASQLKIKDDEFRRNAKSLKSGKSQRGGGIQLLHSRSKRIFDKLFVTGRGQGENKSSETSGSSHSPIPGEIKSSSSSRHRRHSIS